MKFIALVSGGKDSVYTIQVLKEQGHTPVGLLYMKNTSSYVDSYMYQTVGSEVVELFGKCMDLPLFLYETKCETVNTELEYKINETDEVEDLYEAIKDVQTKLDFDAISSGAILSMYQKNRILNVAQRLNISSLTPLWGRNQRELLIEMVENEIKAEIVKIASSFFDKTWIGTDISKILETNICLYENFCGEGGEYETVVLDCKLFKYKIKYNKKEIFCHPDENIDNATVFFSKYINLSLVKK